MSIDISNQDSVEDSEEVEDDLDSDSPFGGQSPDLNMDLTSNSEYFGFILESSPTENSDACSLTFNEHC